MRITRVYTRRGDDGTTALAGGQRVTKDALRVQAYGTVDELNSVIGAALASGLCERIARELPAIQNDLFHLGSDLSVLEADKASRQVQQIEARHVERLERLIDELNQAVGPAKNFVVPGGAPGAAQLHVARTICRRAERLVVALSHVEPIGPRVLTYLNRLSDALFVMARYENRSRGIAEILWDEEA